MSRRVPLLLVFHLALLPVLTPGTAQARETLEGPITASLVDVIDGDTLKARARIWLGQEVLVNIRLAGIDTPEAGYRARCEAEREQAVLAKEALQSFLGEDALTLRNIAYGKYAGRVLADVANAKGEDAATALIEAGLARRYNGGVRAGWCEMAEERGP